MRHRAFLLFLLAPAAHAATPCAEENLRWAASTNSLYVSGDTSCTLTDLRRLAPADVPLTLVDPGGHTWLLGANLLLEDGATLVLDGTARGGDVDELRLKSENSFAYNARVELTAEWGNLLIRGTRVTSWDPDAGGPDEEYELFGRAFVRVVSFLDGDVPRQSRMDVIDSDIGHLGYYAAESYGLVWKVRDPTPDVFEVVDVFGDITNSTVHHNYFGMYSYGAYGMRITGSEFSDNVMYGIDPHDDSDALLIEGNYTHHNGNHGFICSKRCDRITVRGNTSSFNEGIGFMFHRDVVNSILEDNLAEDNEDAGFALMDSHHNVVRNNTARRNAYGVRLSVGASENLLMDNVLTENALYGIYIYQGSDLPTRNDGRPTVNRFWRNESTGNGMYGLRASASHANDWVENVFADNARNAAFLFDSGENVFHANDLGGSYIHLDGASRNAVTDSDAAGVLLEGADASMTFLDSTGRVFGGDGSFANVIADDGSAVTLTGVEDAAVVGVEALPLAVTPTGGDVEVRAVAWSGVSRSWTTSPGTASSARFVVGGLVPRSAHTLWVDGVARASLSADALGTITHTADVTAPHNFLLTSSRTARPFEWKGNPATVVRPGRIPW